METVKTILRSIRAIVGYYHEAGKFEHCACSARSDLQAERRLRKVSDSYKALLLASPGR